MQYKGICLTDLDGTLLDLQHRISQTNLTALYELGELGICRVAATGRSLYSLRRVITPDMPFDFVIFTTGAGIINWKTQNIISTRHIENPDLTVAFQKLWRRNLDFMMHAPIPENHRFVYVRGPGLEDFFSRIKFYQAYAMEWDGRAHLPWNQAAQFLVVADKSDLGLYQSLVLDFPDLRVVRTTSPIDHESLWLEIVHKNVSKGIAAQYLAALFHLEMDKVMVVGNDYNDEDMLCLTRHAFVTENAPDELKNIYTVVADHTRDGFAEAVQRWKTNI
jgi:Cof subfamily protein (haloacid dehalogenase superfamily)